MRWLAPYIQEFDIRLFKTPSIRVAGGALPRIVAGPECVYQQSGCYSPFLDTLNNIVYGRAGRNNMHGFEEQKEDLVICTVAHDSHSWSQYGSRARALHM